MAEPTLGEITSIHGDPSLALADTGVASNVIAPNTTELSFLDAAARRRDAANKFILQQHQANLKNTLENFNNIDTSGLFSPDYKDITNQYKDLTSQIYDNFDVIQNPNKNPELYSQLMQQESALRAKIAQSKAQGLVYAQNQKLLEAHPEFNTPENLRAQQQFTQTPIDQRQIPNITPPTVYNPSAIIKAATEAATQRLATSDVSGGYIKNKTTEFTDPDTWYKTIANVLGTNNGYGGTYKDALAKQYNDLPPQVKQTESFDDFIKQTFPVPKSSVLQSTTTGDPIVEEKMRQAYGFKLANLEHSNRMIEQAAAQANQLKIAELRGELKTETDFNKTGTTVNTLTASLFDPANEAPQTLSYTNAKTGKTEHLPVVSVPESQKALFAYTKYDPLGKKITVMPDILAKTPDGHIRAIFFEEDTKDKLNTGGAAKIDKGHTQDFTPDNIRNILFNEIPANGRAKAQSAAIKQSQSLNDPNILKTYLNGGSDSNSSGDVAKIITKTSDGFTYKGKTYSPDDLKKAAAASGMTPDEYIQELNKQ